MRRLSTLLFAAALLAACGGSGGGQTASPPPPAPPPATTSFGIEVIVRTGENFHTADEVTAFVTEAQAAGVKAISLLVKQDEDGDIASGSAYYASTLAPRATGYAQFDALRALLDAARPRGIRVQAWIPLFHDQVAARAHPEWQMQTLKDGQVVPYTGARQTEYFVDPLNAAVQDYQRAIIREVVTNYAVDGVMLDWIRFDNYPMDLGNTTRARYRAATGIDPLTIDFTTDNAARRQWNEFRTDGIADYVRAVRADVPPAMALGVYILPPEFVEVAQDAGKFNAATQVLSPMCYFRDWGYALDWVWSSCLATTRAKAGTSRIVPAMDSGLTDAQYAELLARIRRDFPSIDTLTWFYHGRWDAERLRRIARLSAL